MNTKCVFAQERGELFRSSLIFCLFVVDSKRTAHARSEGSRVFLGFGKEMAKRTALPKCTRYGRAAELNSLGFLLSHLCFAFVREYFFSHNFICSQSKWNSMSLSPWFVNGATVTRPSRWELRMSRLRRAGPRIAARVALRLLTKVRWVAAATVLQRARSAHVRVGRRARVRCALRRRAWGALVVARRHVTARLARRLLWPEFIVCGAAVRRSPRGAHVRVGKRAAVARFAHRFRAIAARESRFTAGHVAAARARHHVPPRIRRGRATTR